MNIIIAGAGKVGFNLAKTLCIGHNVIIIDKNADALERIQESLDILPHKGDVEHPLSYKSFASQEIDLFIAVTNSDNVNLVSTMVADAVLQIKRKFIRLQSHLFEQELIQNNFHVDTTIFPIQLTSDTITSLLRYPKANNVKFFKYTPFRLISIKVSSRVIPHTIDTDMFKLVGIERKKQFFIPQGDVEIFPNDLIYLFGDEEKIKAVCQLVELEHTLEISKCVVFGGEELGITIAKDLLSIGQEVKLVEKDMQLCHKADEALGGRADIINYKYGSHDVFEDEGLDAADMFIAATNNDEYNIIKCLEAQESGIKKVVAVNNEMEYYNLMHSLGIVVVRGPKMSAYNTIMEEISSTGVVIQKSFCGAKAVVFMRKIFITSKLINKSIKPAKTQQSALFYVREGHIHHLTEKVKLQQDDLVVAFCPAKESAKVKQWIYEL